MILGPRGAFKNAKTDEDKMKRFNEWNQSVIDNVPKDRLLIYKASEGWEPICRFLNVDVPDIPFLIKNKTKNMGRMSIFINFMFIILVVAIISIIASSIFWGVQYFQ